MQTITSTTSAEFAAQHAKALKKLWPCERGAVLVTLRDDGPKEALNLLREFVRHNAMTPVTRLEKPVHDKLNSDIDQPIEALYLTKESAEAELERRVEKLRCEHPELVAECDSFDWVEIRDDLFQYGYAEVVEQLKERAVAVNAPDEKPRPIDNRQRLTADDKEAIREKRAAGAKLAAIAAEFGVTPKTISVLCSNKSFTLS